MKIYDKILKSIIKTGKTYRMKPIDFFSFRRLDLIVKYLQAKNYLASIYNKTIEDLYVRHIIMRTSAVEPENPFTKSNTPKQSTQDYLTSFKNLVLNMKERGFNDEFPIPVNSSKNILDGAHRIAASMALGLDNIPTRENSDARFWGWDFKWFCDNGFTLEDKQRILKSFIDLHPQNSAIFLLYHPLMEHYDNIRKIIDSELDIVGEIELDFEKDFIAFENILYDIYDTNRLDKDKFSTITEKINILKTTHLSFKVIVVTNQTKSKNENIFKTTLNLKEKIRDLFNYAIPKNVYVSLHGTDNAYELKWLSEIVLSPNNIRYSFMRNHKTYTDEFFTQCQHLKNACINEKIPIENICVVGSGPLAAVGIKSTSDLDFTVLDQYRPKYGDLPKNISPFVDLVTKTYHKNGTEIYFTDDELIQDNNNYFIVNGLKFLNLEIVRERKAFSKREKDIRHVRLIDLYFNLNSNSAQKQLFFQRIRQEQLRREEKITNENTA